MDGQFLSQEVFDDRLRPYTTGIHEHPEALSTIVLYSDEEVSPPAPSNSNYTDDKNMQTVKGMVSQNDGKVSLATYIPSNIATISPNPDARVKYFGIFNNFSLIQVEESKDQIVKLHQNFGASWNLFFFGDTPNVYTFSGVFIDTWEYPYYQEFMTMYDLVLAGRKCVENKYKMKIIYDNKSVGGYLIRIRTVTAASTPNQKMFSFTVIINSEEYMRYNMALNPDNVTIADTSGSNANKLGYNAMNNGHRIVNQYPNLLADQSGK